jgi:hypothetical protein
LLENSRSKAFAFGRLFYVSNTPRTAGRYNVTCKVDGLIKQGAICKIWMIGVPPLFLNQLKNHPHKNADGFLLRK